jgi:NAD(P)-dependent dehydrogenase (short-subunit alcohol dehydrogenase family)
MVDGGYARSMINPMQLSGKRILVTGGSSGIGRETAIHLSRLGANVVLLARDEKKLEDSYNKLDNGAHQYISYDVSNINGIKDLLDKICKDNIKLDGYVHSAGVNQPSPVQTLKYDDLHKTMLVNFYSFIEFSRILSKKKYNNMGCSIVGISSVSSKVATKGYCAYSSSKGAMDSAVRVMATEFASKNIRVNTVNPSWIATDMYNNMRNMTSDDNSNNQLNRQLLGLGTPLDVANAVAYLLSDASKFITGTSLIIDGGYLAQ